MRGQPVDVVIKGRIDATGRLGCTESSMPQEADLEIPEIPEHQGDARAQLLPHELLSLLLL
jgi:hypothetical protein